MLVKIEQRLQDPPRFLMISADEAAVFGVPFMMGMLGKAMISGAIFAFILWTVWRRLKGEGGLVMMVAALYWYVPRVVNIFPGFPDSSVTVWEG